VIPTEEALGAFHQDAPMELKALDSCATIFAPKEHTVLCWTVIPTALMDLRTMDFSAENLNMAEDLDMLGGSLIG
jgi:hypothetical protein